MTALHDFGDAIHAALSWIPLPYVRIVFLAVPAILLVWVLRLPRTEAVPPTDHPRWHENLKLWAGLALVMQVVIYLVF